MNPFQGAVLGLIQGVSEFLPISSSGHLVLIPWLLGWKEPGLPFDTTVHLGTLVGVLAFFHRDLIELALAWLSDIKAFRLASSSQSKLAWLIILGTVPAAIMGLLLEEHFQKLFSDPLRVAGFMVVTGIVLALSEARSNHQRELESLSWFDSLLIGIAQGCAIAPGISRSGATIAMGLFRKLRRETAARYSFLLSVPIILGTGLAQLKVWLQSAEAMEQAPTMAAGFLMASLSGYFSIKYLLVYLGRGRFYPFALYCGVVGILFILLALVRG